MRSDNVFSGDRGRGTPFGVPEAVEKLSFFGQPLDRNHAFDRIPKKKRALQAHFFFPCINSEIRALGIYEFAPQILFYACCRTKHKRRNSAFLTDWGGMTSSRHCKYLHVVICGGGHPALQPCFYNSIISCLPHRKNIDFTRPIRYNHR